MDLPKRSDVSFSPRFGYQSGADVFALAEAFHATRIDWTYGSAEFLRDARSRGYACTAAISPLVGRPDDLSDRMRSAAGAPLAAPWQPWPGAYWGCFNNPTFRALFISTASRALADGATGIQIDDAGGNLDAVRWGGCWCMACRQKARSRGADLAKTMREFQRASVAEFYAEVFSQLPPGTPVSSNNYFQRTTDFPARLFAFGMTELDSLQLTHRVLFEHLWACEQAGRRQVLTLRSRDLAENRRAIASIYALGGLMIAPWDVYLKSTPSGSERHFGRPEDVADLYGFIRAQAAWLDAFELVSARGVGVAQRADLLKSDMPGALHILRQAPDGRLALHVVGDKPLSPGRVQVRTSRRAAFIATPNGVQPASSHWANGWLAVDTPAANGWMIVQIS